jgi:acyl-CoA thioesterase YciA
MTDTQAVYAAPVAATEPCGDLSIRTPAMPADTNQNGDIFGGWLLSQMDIGGGIFASKVTKSRSYGRDRGDEFSQTRVRRRCGFGLRQPGADRQDFHHRPSRSLDPAPPGTNSILVTDGNFTYVSIDDQGQPQIIKQEELPISA